MSTKNEALKIVIATLFVVFCLQPFLDSNYLSRVLEADIYADITVSQILDSIGYQEIMKSVIYLLLALLLLIIGRKITVLTGVERRNWLKALYVLPAALFIAAMVRRVGHLKVYLGKIVEEPRNAHLWFGEVLTVDCNRLLRETAIILFLLFIINSLVLRKKAGKKENNTGKCAYAAATLFAVLAVNEFYLNAVYMINTVTSNRSRFATIQSAIRYARFFIWKEAAFCMCVYIVIAVALFKGKRNLLKVGAGALFLWIIYHSGIPDNIQNVIGDISYIFGYGCIVAFSIATLILEEEGKGLLKSKLWLIFPVLFFALNYIFNLQESGILDYSSIWKHNSIWEHNSIIGDFALFFAMLWAIYPKGLPKWRKRKEVKAVTEQAQIV